MNTDFLPPRRRGAELLRGGVGQDFGGDFAEGVGGQVAYPWVWIGQLVEQQGHGHAGLLAVPAKCLGCAGAKSLIRFAETVCQCGNNYRWIAPNPAQRRRGPSSHFVIVVLKALEQHWHDWYCIGGASGNVYAADYFAPIRRVGVGKRNKKRWKPILPHFRQNTDGAFRCIRGISVVHHFQQAWNRSVKGVCQSGNCQRSEERRVGK